MHQHPLLQAVPEVQHQVLQPLRQELLLPGLPGSPEQQGEERRLEDVGGEDAAPLGAEGLLQAPAAQVPQPLEDLQALEVAGVARGLLLEPAQQPLLLLGDVEPPEGLQGAGSAGLGFPGAGLQGDEIDRVPQGDGGDEAHGHGEVAADVVGARQDVQGELAARAGGQADAAALLQPVEHGAQAPLQVALEPAQHQGRGQVAPALQLHAEALAEGPVAPGPGGPLRGLQGASEGAAQLRGQPRLLGAQAAGLQLQARRQPQRHQDVEAVRAADLVLLVGAADLHEVPAQGGGQGPRLQPLRLGRPHQLAHDAAHVRLTVAQQVRGEAQLLRVEVLQQAPAGGAARRRLGAAGAACGSGPLAALPAAASGGAVAEQQEAQQQQRGALEQRDGARVWGAVRVRGARPASHGLVEADEGRAQA
ncbi:thioredoxin reductase 1, cytoplasmic [Platysternon megacephalum]|uniref:Thioredoxin reductase 1, cytoplasmic n=1 Tax=Platysternon megacephalum TaxID=55544 RepID=A0A4D9E7M7_9SAUR|nr:thioredoxin reductase 1, cytoplasmic [Platysternon megacephalum]